MTSDLRIQGEVVVNSEQAESAFNRVGDKAQQMATEVATSAGKAGQAVDKIGDGAGASAEKFTRAESRISASIKRATNELELLGKTASQRLEFNIADKGLDAAKFEPALKKLRELEAQAQAAQRAASGSLDKMGISAAQTAAALRGVPAQFTDIVTSLQGGQAPLTVFLQQGGQLKDMFGGAGNAARALGGYVLGLVNPFTVAAAAAAALAYAYNQGSKEADAYNNALITTGNAAGTNAAQLKAYAQEISAVVGTQGKAAESLAALASTGKIGAESLKEAAQAAVQYERATGQAVSKTAEQFASLRNEPLAAVLKLNDGMNFLTDSTYKQIKSLEEQGKTAEAANVAQRAFADTLAGRAGEMERNLGTVERGWLAVKDAAKSAWDAILNVGRASTNVDQLAAVRKQIADRENQLANAGFGANGGGAAFGRPSQAATERLKAELSALQAQAAALEGVAFASRTAAEEERKRGEQVKATAAFDKAGEKYLTDKARMERELAAARVQGAEAGKSQAEIEQRLAQIRASYAKKGSTAAENNELRDQMRVFADLAGVSSTYYTELANYQKQRANNVITEQQYVQAVEALIKKQPFAVALAKEQADATKAQAKASEEAARAHLKYVESFAKGANAAQQQADQLRTEEAAAAIAAGGYYSLAQAIELVTIARLEEKRDGLLGNEEAYLAVQKEIDARKELVGLIGAKEARKAAEDSAKKAASEWERASEKINDTLTDALMRGFESGKDFAKNLRDTVVNMFKTMVLRPVISAIVSPVAGAITGALGLAGTANAGTSALSTVGNIGGIYSGLSSATTAGLLPSGISAALAGSTNAFAMGLSGAWGAGGGLMSTLGAGTSLIGSGSIMSGLGVMAGALGPIALGLGALVSLLGKKSTPHVGGGASYGADMGLITGAASNDFIREWTIPESAYRDEANKAAATMAKTISQTLDGVAKQFGQQMGYVVGTGFADDSSKDGAWGALRIALGGRTVADWGNPDDKWAGVTFADGEKGAQEYAAKVASTVREVLNGMDLPGWASRIAKSMPADGTMDDLTQVLATISAYPAQLLQQFGTSRDALVQQFAQGLATGDATAAGQSVADSLVQSVQNAVYTNAAGQLFDIVNQGIVTPVLDAMANGAALSEALSEATIQGTIDRAKEQAQKLAELYGNDEFRSVLDTLRTTVGSALGGAGGYIQSLPNTLTATQQIDSAAQSAAQAAEDARKKWQDITDGLLSDRFQADMALLRALGREEEAVAQERLRAIAGYDEYQISLYDGTQAILGQVAALERQAEAAEEARQKALELAQTLASELPAVLDKYRTPDQRIAASYDRIAADLGAAGINVSAQTLMGASKDQIAQAAMAVYNLGTTTDDMRLALIRAASGLADLKDEALALEDAARKAAAEEARRRREQAQGMVDSARGTLDGLIKSLTADAARATGTSIGRLGVTGAEYEQYSGFADAIGGATKSLQDLEKLGLGREFERYADQIRAIVRESETLLAGQLSTSRLLQGNAAGALAALGAVGDLRHDGSAADYNAARARLDADNALRLYTQASADALAVSGIDGVLGTLQITLADPQLWQPAAQAITQGIVQASGDVGFAVRDAVAGVAEVLARQGLTSVSGPGIAGVHAAQAKLDFASVGGWARGSWQMGEDVVAYGQALDRLDGMLKTGKLSAQEHADAIGALNTAMGGAAALLGDTAAQAERLAAAQQALGDAGLQSIDYYFSWYGRESDRLAEAARQAGTALGQTTDAIGRLNSASSVFGQSATAAASWEDYAGNSSIGLARLVADSAKTASAAMTTADAERAAAALAKTGVFANARDAALLLDGIGQYDSKGFEDAFTRINAALGRGQVSEAQYKALFDTALELYKTGTTSAAEAARNLTSSFERLRDVMGDFADGLLIGDKTTLDAGRTLAEIQRQYTEAFIGSANGDTDAMGKYTELANTLLDKSRYDNQAEYNAVFGRVYGDARELQAHGVNVLANQQNGVVTELKAMNASLNKRVEDLEKNLVAALAQIAKNTSDTNKGVARQTVIIEEQGA